MNILKPCPFCGKTPHIGGSETKEYFNDEWADFTRKEFWVIPTCEVTCPIGMLHSHAYRIGDGIRFISIEKAIEFWNKRFNEPVN